MTSFPCIYSVFEIIGPLLCFMFVLCLFYIAQTVWLNGKNIEELYKVV